MDRGAYNSDESDNESVDVETRSIPENTGSDTDDELDQILSDLLSLLSATPGAGHVQQRSENVQLDPIQELSDEQDEPANENETVLGMAGYPATQTGLSEPGSSTFLEYNPYQEASRTTSMPMVFHFGMPLGNTPIQLRNDVEQPAEIGQLETGLPLSGTNSEPMINKVVDNSSNEPENLSDDGIPPNLRKRSLPSNVKPIVRQGLTKSPSSRNSTSSQVFGRRQQSKTGTIPRRKPVPRAGRPNETSPIMMNFNLEISPNKIETATSNNAPPGPEALHELEDGTDTIHLTFAQDELLEPVGSSGHCVVCEAYFERLDLHVSEHSCAFPFYFCPHFECNIVAPIGTIAPVELSRCRVCRKILYKLRNGGHQCGDRPSSIIGRPSQFFCIMCQVWLVDLKAYNKHCLSFHHYISSEGNPPNHEVRFLAPKHHLNIMEELKYCCIVCNAFIFKNRPGCLVSD